MRFLSFAKPLAVALALSFAASNLGCAAPTTGEEAGEVGTQRQAIDASAIAGGAQAAMQILTMLDTYVKYGEPVISQGEILTKVKEVEADLTALRTSVNDLQVAVLRTDMDVQSQPVVRVTNNIEAIFQGYQNAAASSDPTALQTYLDSVVAKTATQGTLTWADLGDLSAQLTGTMTSNSLFMLLAQSEAKKGTASIDNDALDRFMADKLLVQAEGFFLLSKMNANNPSVDLAQWKATYDARIANQKETFFAAVREMNRLVLADVAAPREAQVGQCYYAGVEILGIPVAPNEGTYAFRDQGAIDANTAYWGPQGCADNRTAWIRRVTDEVKAPWVAKQAEAQNIYNVLNLEGQYVSPSGGKVQVTVVDGYRVRWMNPNPGPGMRTDPDGSLHVSLTGQPSTLSGDGDQPFTVKFGDDGHVASITPDLEGVTYTRAPSQH